MTNKEYIICLKCGAKNPKNARFCEKCGYSLDIPNPVQKEDSEKSGALKIGFIKNLDKTHIFLILITVISLFFIMSMLSTPAYTETYQHFNGFSMSVPTNAFAEEFNDHVEISGPYSDYLLYVEMKNGSTSEYNNYITSDDDIQYQNLNNTHYIVTGNFPESSPDFERYNYYAIVVPKEAFNTSYQFNDVNTTSFYFKADDFDFMTSRIYGLKV